MEKVVSIYFSSQVFLIFEILPTGTYIDLGNNVYLVLKDHLSLLDKHDCLYDVLDNKDEK